MWSPNLNLNPQDNQIVGREDHGIYIDHGTFFIEYLVIANKSHCYFSVSGVAYMDSQTPPTILMNENDDDVIEVMLTIVDATQKSIANKGIKVNKKFV